MHGVIMKQTIAVIFLLALICASYCELIQGSNKTSDDASSPKTQQKLSLPNLDDCKDSMWKINLLLFMVHLQFSANV